MMMLIPNHSQDISDRARIVCPSTQRRIHQFRVEFLFPWSTEHLKRTLFNGKYVQWKVDISVIILRNVAKFYSIGEVAQEFETLRRAPEVWMVTNFLRSWPSFGISIDHRHNQVGSIRSELQIVFIWLVLHNICFTFVPFPKRMRSWKYRAIKYAP